MISNPRSPIISAKGKVKTFALDHVELAISLYVGKRFQMRDQRRARLRREANEVSPEISGFSSGGNFQAMEQEKGNSKNNTVVLMSWGMEIRVWGD